MVVQQLVVNLVFSQETKSACPPTLPSWAGFVCSLEEKLFYFLSKDNPQKRIKK